MTPFAKPTVVSFNNDEEMGCVVWEVAGTDAAAPDRTIECILVVGNTGLGFRQLDRRDYTPLPLPGEVKETKPASQLAKETRELEAENARKEREGREQEQRERAERRATKSAA